MDYDIINYDAIGDGSALDTQAIQYAIDAAHQAGGRTVVIPSGARCVRTDSHLFT